MSKTVNYQDVLSKIFKIWIVCFGAITLQVVAGYFVSHVLLPYIGFALILCIIAYGNYNLRNSSINCSMMTHYTVYTLALSGVIMLVINLLNTNLIANRYSEFSHHNYPFHAIFIVYPVAAIFFGTAIFRRGKTQYCRACRSTAEFSMIETMRRNVLHHEAKAQLWLAFGVSLALSIVAYAYYFLVYSNDASSVRYSPDIFFMYILPAVAYGVTVIYVFTRFLSAEFEISLKNIGGDNVKASHIRYMVVWRDSLLLKDVVGDGLSSLWDTPADVNMPVSHEISMHQAEVAFRRLTDTDRFTLKRLFSTSQSKNFCLHCAAFYDDEADKVNELDGQWFSLREVDMMLKLGVIARPFAVELHRVFTITMAWKTYDREGKRLYPIKNYRPTFRLRDFKDWDVDYEDLHWMSVAEHNEDKPFYQWRRFWRRYVSGLDKRWEKKHS